MLFQPLTDRTHGPKVERLRRTSQSALTVTPGGSGTEEFTFMNPPCSILHMVHVIIIKDYMSPKQ